MIYGLYNAGAGNTTTTTSVDVREDDDLVTLHLATATVTATDGDTCYVEVSWISTPQKATNDANGIIARNWITTDVTTSGAIQGNVSAVIPLHNIKAEAGERLYVHVVTTGTGTFPTYATIQTAKEGMRRSQKRR